MNIDINLIVDFILKVILILFTVLIVPKLQEWLSKKIGEQETDKLIALIYELVRAAEQVLYGKDEDGSLRKKYVIEALKDMGYEWNATIDSYIESAVFDLNREAHQEYCKEDLKDIYDGFIPYEEEADDNPSNEQ